MSKSDKERPEESGDERRNPATKGRSIDETNKEKDAAKVPQPLAPVWHDPKWITAIVAVISAFLTIPDVVGNYLSKQQDIEFEREKTKTLEIDNSFNVVNNTLARLGEERIFVLRYLSKTLRDEEARAWAVAEVKRLESAADLRSQLAQSQKQLADAQAKMTALSSENSERIAEFRQAIAALESEVEKRAISLSKIREEAGLNRGVAPQYEVLFVEHSTETPVVVDITNKIFPGSPDTTITRYRCRSGRCEFGVENRILKFTVTAQPGTVLDVDQLSLRIGEPGGPPPRRVNKTCVQTEPNVLDCDQRTVYFTNPEEFGAK